MKLKQLAKLWQLGIAAGMLFGFGSNAMDVIPLSTRMYLKGALLVISGVLILVGYTQLRRIEADDLVQLSVDAADTDDTNR